MPVLDVVVWTDEQQEQARKWASKVHAKASDNPVRVPPEPEHVQPFRPGAGRPSSLEQLEQVRAAIAACVLQGWTVELRSDAEGHVRASHPRYDGVSAVSPQALLNEMREAMAEAPDVEPAEVALATPATTAPASATGAQPTTVGGAQPNRLRIYVASSWRNEARQQEVVRILRAAGHEVYDFRNPAPGNTGFSWREVHPGWESWTPEEYREALSHPVAERGFSYDMNALRACDACVLVGPCGRSAHLELGWAVGAGKFTVVLLAPGEAELMVKMCDQVCLTTEEMAAALERFAGEASATGAKSPPGSQEPQDPTFAELVAYYQGHLQRKRASTTTRFEEIQLRATLRWLSDNGIERPTAADWKRYFEWRLNPARPSLPSTAGTVQHLRAVVSKVYQRCAERPGWLSVRNPVSAPLFPEFSTPSDGTAHHFSTPFAGTVLTGLTGRVHGAWCDGCCQEPTMSVHRAERLRDQPHEGCPKGNGTWRLLVEVAHGN
ncbi:MAG: hypothetical protein ACJ8AT_35550 [Hyalangium sp.]|uniref:hypothetical protein n=1 Tax=Hyalangium sp. TaxID=2028555 RepID=UPI00389B101F